MLHGYRCRYVMALHLAHMVPRAGIVAHKRFPNHDLLPTFELDCPGNVVAWNRVRLYLQTYKKSAFSKQQLIVTFVSAINVVLLVAVFVSTFSDPAAAPRPPAATGENLTAAGGLAMFGRRAQQAGTVARISQGEVGIFLLQVAIHQVVILSFIMAILWTGVKTTRLLENGIRYVLLLKRAELVQQAAGPGPALYFDKRAAMAFICSADGVGRPRDRSLRRSKS